VKEGDLTAAQAAALHKDDRQIRQEERDMAHLNGHITAVDQKALNQQENVLSKESASSRTASDQCGGYQCAQGDRQVAELHVISAAGTRCVPWCRPQLTSTRPSGRSLRMVASFSDAARRAPNPK
jgi:hypothetical protein